MIKKNILITGGGGFIGSNISLKLLKEGHNVTILDNLSEQIHGKNAEIPFDLKGKVTFIKGDVRNKDDWRKAVQGQDIIVHLAAETGTGQSMYEISKYSEVNINGTANMLDILINNKNDIKKIVLASSRVVYGEGKYNCNNCGIVFPESRNNDDMSKGGFKVKCPICNHVVEPLPTDEVSKIHPISIYGITKQTQEELILTICKTTNIPAVIFRYQNVYGPGQSLSNPYTGILSIFSTRIKNNNDIYIFEDGKESRDFVYIDDVIDATIRGIEKEDANYEIFNVGSGEAIDILQVANTLKNEFNSNVNIKITGDYRIGDIRSNYADLIKIKEKLGYEPKVNFKEGIKKFVKWVEKQGIKNDLYEKSIKEIKKKGFFISE